MLFRQVIHEDLACGSYLVGDERAGVAAVVDPQWDIDPYLRLSRLHGVRIEHVLETHNHADHVSGPRPPGQGHRGDDPHPRARRGRVPARAVRRRLDGCASATWRSRRCTRRPPPRAHLVRAARRRSRRRCLGGADRRLAVRRRRRAARPGGRAARRRGGRSSTRCTSACSPWTTTSRSGPAHLGGSLCGSSAIDNKTSSTIGFERQHNRALRISTRGVVHRRHGRSARRPPAQRRAHRGAEPRPPDRGAGHARAADPAGGGGGDRRGRDPGRRAGPTSSSTRPTSPGRSAPRPTTRASPPRWRRVVAEDVELIVVAASDGYELEAAELLASVGLRVRGFLRGRDDRLALGGAAGASGSS